MTSRTVARPVPLGEQRPRLLSVPPFDVSEGRKAADLADLAGLHLDEWQRFVLEQGLGRAGGKWSAFEVALIVSRQNGKGSVLEALELAALFLFDDVRLILHSAHEFKTAAEAFLRIRALIADNPMFERRVERVRTGAGTESIELKDGKRLRFVARTSGSGRGFSADLVILDEAFNLGDDAMAALLPTLSARPDPQVWYTSTAGEPTSVQLGRVRDRGISGSDPSLAFMEWSVDPDDYDPGDLGGWAKANPGLGLRITAEHVTRERAALAPDMFARERLGVGLYPTDLADAWQVISRDAWAACLDEGSVPCDPVAFAADAMPGGSHASIGVAGRRVDGLPHVEVVDHRPGTAWVVPRLLELVRKHNPCCVVVDPTGQAGSLVAALEAEGVEVTKPAARDAAAACGQFFEAVTDSGTLRHRGDAALSVALGGAQSRPLSDSWAWARRSAHVDISPLVAVTLALWGHAENAPGSDPGIWLV
jgi:Phage Terminase